jgi:NAD-dependent dihydropyrimidine dehydrogenase PreA subunit
MLFLKSVPGNVIVLGWLYERAIRWTLDRAGVRGQEGLTLLKSEDEDDSDEEASDTPPPPSKGIGSVDIPNRRVYCIDLRASPNTDDFVNEIRRIRDEHSVQTVDLMGWINGSPKQEQLQRYLEPDRLLEARRASDSGKATTADKPALPEDTRRRWYPVIDYSRCTNCMECIDFCLFGVYGVDQLDRILVEEQDNCKKGCPACSRVCPENAIIFPQHKTPAIAGADGDVGGIKIDLSKLFGGDDGLSAVDMAVKERDAELILDGREAVGASVGLKQRDRDEIDDLMDELDALEF